VKGSCVLEKDYGLSGGQLRKIFRVARIRDGMMVVASTKGYFWAVKKKELKAYCITQEKWAYSILAATNKMKATWSKRNPHDTI